MAQIQKSKSQNGLYCVFTVIIQELKQKCMKVENGQ